MARERGEGLADLGGSREPWRDLPKDVADAIEPELPQLTEEIVAAIAREVPEYAQPLEGAFGRGIRVGVAEALRQFVALIRDPETGREQGREVYVGLGRGELRAGRSLDALQSAYRVGARVAWRRLSATGLEAGLAPRTLHVLAEAIFAYIDGLSAESVEGYSEARSALEGERERRRRGLLALLVREPPAEEREIRASAADAGWSIPRTATMLACGSEELGRLARRLPPDVLASTIDDLGCAVVPDPDGPGRARELDRAAAGTTTILGPTVEFGELAASWEAARATFGALRAGAIGGEGLVRADDRQMDVLLFEARPILSRIGARRLRPLEDLTAAARARMEETLRAYLRLQGRVPAMASELHVHQQTVRHRLRRLRELFGSELDDPDARFELEAVLRERT